MGGKRYPTLMERMMSKITPEPNTGCWLWMEGTGNGGYGATSMNGERKGAHRVIFELFKGPIPEGMELDHLCRVRACCNPDHMEPVTRRENLRRGIPGEAWVKTSCHNGHPYSPENTYYRKGSGKKQCRLCARITDRKRSKRKRHVASE